MNDNDMPLDLSKTKIKCINSPRIPDTIMHCNSKTDENSFNNSPLDLSIKAIKKSNIIEVPNKAQPFKAIKNPITPNYHHHHHQNNNTNTKMVRGQDEWLNNTKNNFISQILKCLECSKSFESLADLSAHMHKTKHFLKFNSKSKNTSTATTNNILNYNTHNINLKKRSKIAKIQLNSNNIFIKNSASNNGVLLCLICHQRFSTGMSLIEHLQNNHTITQICTSCGAYFESYDEYHKHLISENYHHHNHQQQRHRNTNLAQSTSMDITSNNKRKLKNNENINEKKVKIDENDKNLNDTEQSKSPLLALELLVKSKTDDTCVSNAKMNTFENNPLNLLTKMHSSLTNYVF